MPRAALGAAQLSVHLPMTRRAECEQVIEVEPKPWMAGPPLFVMGMYLSASTLTAALTGVVVALEARSADGRPRRRHIEFRSFTAQAAVLRSVVTREAATASKRHLYSAPFA